MKYYILAFLVILATALSFDHGPLLHSVQGDSSVFIYISRLIVEGKMPYLDAFDHKGPLLFLLDALGLSLFKGIIGIWIVDILFMLVSLSYGFYWVRKLFGGFCAFVFCFICCSVSVLGYGGNFVESWALYFIVPVSIGLLKMIKGCDSCYDDYIAGLCIAAIALLRVNMIACGMMYAGYVLYLSIKRRSLQYFLTHSLRVIIGVSVLTLPIFFWLWTNGAFGEFVNQYIIFNMRYISSLDMPVVWSFYAFFVLLILSATIVFNIYLGHRIEYVVMWIYFMLAFAIVGINPSYARYFSVLAVPCALTICVAYSYSRVKVVKVAFIVCCLGFFSFIWFRFAFAHTVQISEIKRFCSNPKSQIELFQNWSKPYEQLRSFSELIKEPDSVFVIGNDCYVYDLLHARTKSKYPYQSPLTWFSLQVRSEVAHDLEVTKDRYLIRRKKYRASPMVLIPQGKYHQVAETDDFELLERN